MAAEAELMQFASQFKESNPPVFCLALDLLIQGRPVTPVQVNEFKRVQPLRNDMIQFAERLIGKNEEDGYEIRLTQGVRILRYELQTQNLSSAEKTQKEGLMHSLMVAIANEQSRKQGYRPIRHKLTQSPFYDQVIGLIRMLDEGQVDKDLIEQRFDRLRRDCARDSYATPTYRGPFYSSSKITDFERGYGMYKRRW